MYLPPGVNEVLSSSALARKAVSRDSKNTRANPVLLPLISAILTFSS